MKILLTGIAGFIGNTLAYRLGREKTDYEVLGVDNLNDYYDITLKEARLKRLELFTNIHFQKMDIAETDRFLELFEQFKPDVVIHLAAQAGVRYSIDHPEAYIKSNIFGFLNVLEGCRHHQVKNLIYASTSSVYGANENMPFSEKGATSHQLSLYAATKKANESMAHSYSALFGIPTTGLRFFTVYGPWGRPDMALFKFTENILEGKPIDVYNQGNHKRDFTYVDDIVEGIMRLIQKPATADEQWSSQEPNPSTSRAPYRIFNIGNGSPVPLMDYIQALEEELGKKAKKNLLPLQAGDVPETWADCSLLNEYVGYRPNTDVSFGIKKFVEWYLEYYKKNTD